MYRIKQSECQLLCLWILIIFMATTFSGCTQGNASSMETGDTSASATQVIPTISENTLKMVNAVFYQTFILGEWRYKGARNLGGTINAYIQIPQPLEMSREVQKSYLRQAICPSSEHIDMWNEIDGIPLSIHIYTYGQKHSLYVDCQNPFTTG